jgi:hypothetical protein
LGKASSVSAKALLTTVSPPRSDGSATRPLIFGPHKPLPHGNVTLDKGHHSHLKEYYQGVLGVDPTTYCEPSTGKLLPSLDDVMPGLFYEPQASDLEPEWKKDLPTKVQLYRQEFGRPSVNHSFTQEASVDTCLYFVLKSKFLSETDKSNLFEATNPLVQHLDTMRQKLTRYDFQWIREPNPHWSSQVNIAHNKVMAMMACLFHYDMDVSLLMRYLGTNYTASYRDVQRTVDTIKPHVDPYLIPHFIRVMTVGCPNYFNYESSRANSVKYWRAGNNKSIAQNLDKVITTMCKEERNNYVIPLPGWMWRYVPNLHFTPQHLLIKPKKKDRQIFDASFRHDATSIPVNMMTSTDEGTELDCDFGSVLSNLLQRIWNLRITYPDRDIVIHANDVKSCFRQLKHHPDVMGAFSYILGDYLFLQCGLTFGSDFSPASWEVIRRIAEQLAEGLFKDPTLRDRYRYALDKLQWQPGLGKQHARFTPAQACSKNNGVLDNEGNPVPTPHDFFVDDDLYAEVFDLNRVEQAVAASIAAIFILLGKSELDKRQDPISFDKMEDLIISWCNIVLGQFIHTRRMTIETPPDYVQATVALMDRHWHGGRKSFRIHDIEVLTGRLCHISGTAPWLRFLMSHIYTSTTAALKQVDATLISTSKHYREMLKEAKRARIPSTRASKFDPDRLAASYASSTTARLQHQSRELFFINRTLRLELDLIRKALSSPWIDMCRPIAHLVDRDPSGIAWSDSSLDAAGGYSINMKFWWYIEWPQEIKQFTLRFVKNNADNTLISINVLEYAGLIINYVAATYFYHLDPNPTDPYPSVLLYADNTTAESWAIKACKRSFLGRALGRLQCALMINNPVGISVAHITTKHNVIADRISRIKRETNTIPEFSSLLQDFPQLKSCKRFHPSNELISLIMDVLLQKNIIDPLAASRQLLSDLDKTFISNSQSE